MVTTCPVAQALSRMPSMATTASGLVAMRSKMTATWLGRSPGIVVLRAISYLSCRAAAKTRSRVAAEMWIPGVLLSTTETVDCEHSASRATSVIVTRRRAACSADPFTPGLARSAIRFNAPVAASGPATTLLRRRAIP